MPAHLTVLYPFADPLDLSLADRQRLRAVIAAQPSFEIGFSEVKRFPDVLWLRPEPEAPLVALTEALAAAFPQYPPYGGRFDSIIPHLTVAQGPAPVLDAVEIELRRRFTGRWAERVGAVSLFATVRRRWVEAERHALG